MSYELKETFEDQAEWRREKARQYPEDSRNSDAAKICDRLAATATAVPTDLERQLEQILADGRGEDWSQALREVGFHRCPEDAEEFVRDFVSQHTKVEKEWTLGEWLEIYRDLDAYIERGGLLSDVVVLSPASLPTPLAGFMGDELGAAVLNRLADFNQRVAKRVGVDQIG